MRPFLDAHARQRRMLVGGQHGHHHVTGLEGRRLKELRRRAGMVFQDPFASLDPRRTVAQTVSEPLEVHGLRTGRDKAARVAELLELVGLDPGVAGRYPHEFSGGQRQRVGIARALAGEPDFLVCDEAIASLDVSVQAQVLNLLRRLQRQLGLTLLFISHDLGVVRRIADRTFVMYAGRVLESGPTDRVWAAPQHPYTRALLAAIPEPDGAGRVPAAPSTDERIAWSEIPPVIG